MLLAGSADGPQPRPKSSDAAGPRATKLLVHYQSVVNVAVWAMVACGAIALIEPSPYDFASFIAIPLWIFGGVTIHRSFLPFFFLLLLQAIVGFFTLLPYWSDADAVLYQYQTAYLTLTGLFFALYVGERTEARAELISQGLHGRRPCRCGDGHPRLLRRGWARRGIFTLWPRFRHLQGSQRPGLLRHPRRRVPDAKSPVGAGAQRRAHRLGFFGGPRRGNIFVVFAWFLGRSDLRYVLHDRRDVRNLADGPRQATDRGHRYRCGDPDCPGRRGAAVIRRDA